MEFDDCTIKFLEKTKDDREWGVDSSPIVTDRNPLENNPNYTTVNIG